MYKGLKCQIIIRGFFTVIRQSSVGCLICYLLIVYAAYETGSPPLFSLVFIFISRNRVQLSDEISSAKEVIKPEYDAEGQSFVEFTGQRKSSVATVKVVKPGSGRFIIKHVDHTDMELDITYFYE